MSEIHKTNLFLSLYDIDKRDGCIVITGTIGTVKTTMCRMILENVDRKTQPAFILKHFICEDDPLKSILQNFSIMGKNNEKRTKKEMIYQLIQFLLNALKEGESALLIIEDAQNLPLPVPEQKRILSSLKEQKKKLLQIILVGQHAHMQILKSPQLKELYQMFSVMYSPCPGKKEEIQKYIEHRLMTTGSTGGISFSPEALALIRTHPLGIPFMIALIFDTDLIGTFTQQTIEKTGGIIENEVENLKLQRKETRMAISEKAPAGPTRINRIRKTVLIPAIVAIFVSAGAIGFFISQNIMTKKTRGHKPEKQAVFYSQNIMTKNNLGLKPEQELPRRQEKMDDTPEELEKKEQFKLAVSYQKSGEFIKAKMQYLEILKLYPMDYEIHNNLGSIYQELGDFDTAIKEYRKAIHIRPNYHKARNNLGVALYKKDNLQAAMSELKIVFEANPKDVQCLTNLGVISKKLGHPDKARRLFEEALSIDPAYTEAHYNLAVILKESEVASAIYHFQKFLEYSGGRYASLEEEVMQHLNGLPNRPKR